MLGVVSSRGGMARWLLGLALVAACGDPGALSDDTGSDGGSTGVVTSGATTASMSPPSDGTSTSSSPGDSTEVPSADSGPGTGTGTVTGTGTGTGTDSTSTGDTTGASLPPWEGEPLPDAEPGQWQWVEVEGTECIDGSPTGVGVRYGEGDGVVIFFQGGGGCFDGTTCTVFYSSFNAFDEESFGPHAEDSLSSGIFADDPDNPVRDWSIVWIPYCTGDIHGGDQVDGEVDGFVGTQQFVGYRNVGLDLERIGATFPSPSHVLVTGVSAGGYGAAYNYERIATAYAYAEIPVTLLDDSGPPMDEAFIPACLQDRWRTLWGLSNTLPADCEGCFEGGWALDFARYGRERHPEQVFGLLSYDRDAVIRLFIAGGLDDCSGGFYSGNRYQDGLADLRDVQLSDDPRVGTYYVSGSGHTFLTGDGYGEREVSGVRLVDWVSGLLAGDPVHVAP